MAFCELKYFSQSLGKQLAANVIVPTRTDEPFAVFYLLHGLSDDHTIWSRLTSIERYVAGLPLAVVMPDGGRGFYTDAHIGQKWESALIEDLIPMIDRTFRTRSERAARCIGGLSMGGYGATKLALKYPELFISANSHSGAVAFAHDFAPAIHTVPDEFQRITGPDSRGGDNDCYALAEKALLLPEKERPALHFDCGTEDFLLDQNRAFIQHLESIGYPHHYQEFPGEHNWDYWDAHISEAIAFHLRHLNIVV